MTYLETLTDEYKHTKQRLEACDPEVKQFIRKQLNLIERDIKLEKQSNSMKNRDIKTLSL